VRLAFSDAYIIAAIVFLAKGREHIRPVLRTITTIKKS
jgi:hypothetical protein